MGLFSFVKDVGSKIFGKSPKKKEPASISVAKAAFPEKKMATPAESKRELYYKKISLLEEEVEDLGLEVTNMCIDLNDEQDTVTVHGETKSQADKEKVILALGNVEGIGTVDDQMTVVEPEPEATFYTVKKGDYLSKISKEVYGDAMKYEAIFEANKPMLKDPNLIYPGQVLRIPPLSAN